MYFGEDGFKTLLLLLKNWSFYYPLTNISEKQTSINPPCERLAERHPSKLRKPLDIWSKHGEITQFHSISNCFVNPECTHTRERRTPQPADLALTSNKSKNRTVSSSNIIQILQIGKALLNLAGRISSVVEDTHFNLCLCQGTCPSNTPAEPQTNKSLNWRTTVFTFTSVWLLRSV